MLMGVTELSGLNEARTRKELIDPALKKAGWDVNNPEQVRIEIPVDGFDPKAWEKVKDILEAGGIYDAELPVLTRHGNGHRQNAHRYVANRCLSP
jgi:hypothetical protein